MSLTKSILIIIGCYLAAVIAFDIIGVLANSLIDIFGRRGKSTMLYYTVWFVAAVFAGVVYFNVAYSYVKTNGTVKTNNWIIIAIALALSALAFVVFYAQGQMQETAMYYVPGNPYMTYTFFITFLLAALLGKNLENGTSVKAKKIN